MLIVANKRLAKTVVCVCVKNAKFYDLLALWIRNQQDIILVDNEQLIK